MHQTDLETTLLHLIATWENEVVEFKEENTNCETSKIGKYFSALANEANLRGLEKAWLIFGVNDKTRKITGTNYRPKPAHLENLKSELKGLEPRVTFRNIHEVFISNKRVILFEIPAAPRGIPIGWNATRYGRAGSSLIGLGWAKEDEIRNQTLANDWSAQIVPQATLDHLDGVAVQKARVSFVQKYANRFSVEEIENWPLSTFLDRAKVTQNGKITRTTLLLLGKPESAYLLSPNPAQMSWKLEGPERAYEHFGPPFLLTTTQVYQKIRNIQIRLLPNDELLPYEISKYDQKIVLEALHNCVAHQDYTRNGRINVIEQPDKLIFENEGSFYEGQPDDYIVGTKTPRCYRNPFLTQAMAELNMIDTMGYGIHEMYQGQAKRYLPMPDYNLNEGNAVCMTIYGSIVDLAYSRLLMQKTDLSLTDVLALDRVQKKLPLLDEAVQHLRHAKLIEGRKPNFHVSAAIAAATSSKADYIRTRAQDDTFYTKLITDYLEKYQESSRADINDLLLKILSPALTQKQKIIKINNLMTKLRRNRVIFNLGSDHVPRWRLAEKKE